MHRDNIKDVQFRFEGSGTIGAALARTGIYRPQNLGDRLKGHYAVTTEQAKDRDVSLFIGLKMEPEPGLRFLIADYQDPEAEDFDFNFEARTLGEFDISIPKTLGSKNWTFYTDQKDQKILEVRTPAELLEADKTMENFHAYLAQKLEDALKKQGIISVLDCDDSISLEYMMVGIFLEYRELQRNPDQLSRRLGL